MTQPHTHEGDPNQPDESDIISTLLEDLHKANDERLFHKAQARKMRRRAEEAEMKAASLQARLDQVEAGSPS